MSLSAGRDPTASAAFAASFATTGACLLAGVATPLLEGWGFATEGHPGAVLFLAPFVLMVTVFHAFIIGLPVRAFLPRSWRASLPVTLCASFLIGALPFPLLALLLSALALGISGEILHAFLGVATAYGGLGMAGGFVFWLLVRDYELAALDEERAGR